MPGDRRSGAPPRLTHVGTAGEVAMVDVTERPPTTRRAAAHGLVRGSPAAAAAIRTGAASKGDVLLTARLAGIQGAKRTPELIPLCHPLALTHVDVTCALDDARGGVWIGASARCHGPTGVEMEALTAVAVAALTVIDMVKAIDPWATIVEVALVEKSGGRSGDRRRPAGGPAPEARDGPPGSAGGG